MYVYTYIISMLNLCSIHLYYNIIINSMEADSADLAQVSV